jgi:spermidine synthase
MYSKALNEMLTHIPICSHKKPKDILLISDDSLLVSDELEKHLGLNLTISNSFEIAENSFDIILIYKKELSQDSLEKVHSSLRDNGLISIAEFGYFEPAFKETLTALSSKFKIVMPYRVESEKPMNYFILASKLYHPTADIILQRAELIEDLNFYTSNLHMGVFELPKMVFDDIKDITKR